MVLSDLSIKKPVFAWMLMLALILFGTIGASRLGVSQMPDVDFPQVTVNLTLAGAAPEIMESDVVDVVEDTCMSVEGIKEITSSSKEGQATVTIEFNLGRNIDAALQDVETKIAQAQRRLPKDLDPPIVTKTNPEDNPIMWIGLSGARSPQFLAEYARYTLMEKLQTVPGVGEIMMGGFRDRNLRIWVDAPRLDAYGLTVPDVLSAVNRQHLELPAGYLATSAREANVRTEGEALSVDDFKNMVVTERNGAQIKLGDVAVVEDGLEDRRRIARIMGMPAQGLGVKKLRGANAVSVARAVRKRLDEVRKALPEGLSLDVVFDGTAPVEDAVGEIEFTLLLSVILTALVCWAFLGSMSSTVNVLLAIPASIMGTFACMYFLGFTLNTFTLLALSLAVGIVVDDAIMVLENIFRHVEHGEERIRGSVVGAREITFAALVATAAIVAIFLPVAFMKGIIGAFFFQFGVTISVCVMLSLLDALTLTPSRCAQFLATGERTTAFGKWVESSFNALAGGYKRTLAPALRHRWFVLGLGCLVFAAAVPFVMMMRKEMTPPQDIGIFLARAQTPVGSSIDTTDAAMRKAEEMLLKRPEVYRYFMAVGGFGGGEVTTGILFVTLKPPSERTLRLQPFMDEMRKEFSAIPGFRVALQDISLQGFTASRGFPIEFSVQGPDYDKLATYSAQIMQRMKEEGSFQDVDTDYLVGMPEVKVRPDRERAAATGVSMSDVAQTINAAVGGVVAGKFKSHGRRYDIRVRLLSGQRTRPEDIGLLKVRAKNGELVPLSTLIHLDERPSLLTINRRGRERAVGVFANVAQGRSQSAALDEVQKIAKEILPEGYHIVMTGGAQVMQESMTQLIFALLLGIAVAYMILAAQFNSFTHPISVLAALPFSLTGAVVVLWACGLSLNIYSFIGIILLMGIVKKNSILLVDFTNQRRLLGESRDEALLNACPVRLRPIMMTSLATVAGALPGALALGPGSELRQPMALAVIGGLSLSTLMTLYVVPALYSILDSLLGDLFGAKTMERSAAKVVADVEVERIERLAHHREEVPVAVAVDENGDGTDGINSNGK